MIDQQSPYMVHETLTIEPFYTRRSNAMLLSLLRKLRVESVQTVLAFPKPSGMLSRRPPSSNYFSPRSCLLLIMLEVF